MIKEIYIVLVVGMIVITGIGTAFSLSEINLKQQIEKTILKSNSGVTDRFYENYSGGKNIWYALKFESNKEIMLENISVRIRGEIIDRRKGGYELLLTNFEEFKQVRHRFTAVWTRDDLYVHIDFGPFNYTYDYFPDIPEETEIRHFLDGWDWKFSPGTWYLIFLAGSLKNCSFQLWINTTEAIEFSATRGDGCLLYTREDFEGTFNMGTANATIMINCRKTVHINNTLVGWFNAFFSPFSLPIGWSKLSYTSPSGKTTTMRTIYLKLFMFPSIYRWINRTIYKSTLISNEPGEWKFKVNAVAGSPRSPYLKVALLVGDVILPQ